MFEIELEVGSVLMIGETVLTVVDIEEEDVTFKIDSADVDEGIPVTLSHDSLHVDDSAPSFLTLPR